MSENPTVFFKEFLLSIWYRQQALIHLLEEKDLVSQKEYLAEISRELEGMLDHFHE